VLELVLVWLEVVFEEEQLGLGLVEVLDGSDRWSGCICRTGLLIGHSSFLALFFVPGLVGIFVVVLFQWFWLIFCSCWVSSLLASRMISSFSSVMVSTCLLVPSSSESVSLADIPPPGER